LTEGKAIAVSSVTQHRSRSDLIGQRLLDEDLDLHAKREKAAAAGRIRPPFATPSRRLKISPVYLEKLRKITIDAHRNASKPVVILAIKDEAIQYLEKTNPD